MSTDDRICRNVSINGRRTCLRMEKAFWLMVEEICAREEMTIAEFCEEVERENWATQESSSLTSAIRVYAATYFHEAATEEGHGRAGHGVLEYGQEAPSESLD